MTIPIRKIKIRKMKMKLNSPFTTSFGTFQDKDFLIIEATDDKGNTGFGESVAFHSPWYSEETVATNAHIIEDFLIDMLRENEISHPKEILQLFEPIRRNNMAKSAIEGAIWDLYAKRENLTLAEALGGERKQIDVGISIGIQPTVHELLETIGEFVDEGYKRIKLKIKPGWDIDVLKEVRHHFPNIQLMADANSAYTLKDIDHVKQLDKFNLTMVEQPLAHDDIIDHATLQRAMNTPICLDESIHSLEDARKAIELGSCKIINIKIGRVGGLTESVRIHDYCKENNIPVWCGGMLESGIGRAHNVALTSLSQFTLPGDTAGSSRYWKKDVIKPEVIVSDGIIVIPEKPGIGYDIDYDALEAFTVSSKVIDL